MPKPNDFSELFRLAQSPAGQKLLSYLQQSGGDALQKAMAQASQGDYAPAQRELNSLLASPEAKKLLKELGGTK